MLTTTDEGTMLSRQAQRGLTGHKMSRHTYKANMRARRYHSFRGSIGIVTSVIQGAPAISLT